MMRFRSKTRRKCRLARKQTLGRRPLSLQIERFFFALRRTRCPRLSEAVQLPIFPTASCVMPRKMHVPFDGRAVAIVGGYQRDRSRGHCGARSQGGVVNQSNSSSDDSAASRAHARADQSASLGQPNVQEFPSALCIGFTALTGDRVTLLLESEGLTITHVTVDNALSRIVGTPIDLIFVSERVPASVYAPIAAQARRISSSTKLLVVGERPRAAVLLDAVRAGAVDWIDLSAEDGTQASRIHAALELGRDERRREERIARLKGICRKLAVTRGEISKQVDSLSDDLTHAWSDVRERLDEAALAGEFRGLLSQELDVEELLRTAMQYLLTKTGATNAAVFLPGSKPTQFGLGAYVHYDCPRTSAAPLLTRLADDVCPRLAASNDIVRFADTDEFVRSLGVEASVLDDAELIAWPAHHGGECYGVFFLFRNRSEPFRDELASLVDVLRPVFAAQMAKLVRVHHRSKFEWPQMRGSISDANDDSGDSSEEERDDDKNDSDGETWRRAA
ncbi:MAG: GAF domain-containing protein [Planctomycetota bacterium]|nr:MAG: GAF domain-containing protein [Planctomycetota bacterium]